MGSVAVVVPEATSIRNTAPAETPVIAAFGTATKTVLLSAKMKLSLEPGKLMVVDSDSPELLITPNLLSGGL
jgi:hypothetical protein